MQQPSPLLYSIDIWPARNSRLTALTQREMNHCLGRCTIVLAWFYLAGSSPEQQVIDLFAQHQRFAVCCPLLRQSGAIFHCEKAKFSTVEGKNHQVHFSFFFKMRITTRLFWPFFRRPESYEVWAWPLWPSLLFFSSVTQHTRFVVDHTKIYSGP